MLTHLALKDFAVVRATELEFGPGMTVISGETGAGKSLLVDALGFLSGLRADSGVVRHGSERAELSADFDLAATPAAMAWLRDNDLDEDGQCQLRRVIRADGGSRAWINGRPATLAQLAELAGQLVEIHGQHEHQALLSRASQLALLDGHARNQAQRDAVRGPRHAGRPCWTNARPCWPRAMSPTGSAGWSTSWPNWNGKTWTRPHWRPWMRPTAARPMPPA